MNIFNIKDNNFEAEGCFNEILINPSLPEGFDSIANDDRDESHSKFWHQPYILTESNTFSVRCLDGGAWDRSTFWGRADSLDEALLLASEKRNHPNIY